METTEVWKPIFGFNGKYEISSLKRIRDNFGLILKPNKELYYECYDLLLGNLWKQIPIDMLYITTFLNIDTLFPEKSKLYFSSEFMGVSFNKATGKWVSGAKINGKHYNFGAFEDEREAGIAYLIGKNL